MDPIWSLQSEVMKILASPRRLEILHLLAGEPKEVGRLAEEMGISQPNVSQHLAVMRAAGIVEAVGDGVDLPLGERVMAVTSFFDGHGGFAEAAIARAGRG